MQHLYRDGPAVPKILREVNGRHAAATELTFDGVTRCKRAFDTIQHVRRCVCHGRTKRYPGYVNRESLANSSILYCWQRLKDDFSDCLVVVVEMMTAGARDGLYETRRSVPAAGILLIGAIHAEKIH